MKIKNVLELDYYELLNVDRKASLQEIERAYELCKSTYKTDSIAYHSLLSEDERLRVLDRIENAYDTLRDAKKRKAYDFELYQSKTDYMERAFFRKTTEKILIEDTTEKTSFWRRIKYLFFSPRKK
ncbi:MAG: DnaJ domain-containing protein [Candidatus Aminicenantes bacterium]|nr:MAG: DnaJ domain-containing protein [Candidatus Aminicenantes bacterium]